MSRIEVVNGRIENVVPVNATVTEFGEPYDNNYFEERIRGKKHLILIGQIDQNHAGYMVSYEDERYPDSFYIWMTGVDPRHRGQGVLRAMMQYQEDWAKKEGYKKLVLKTRNSRREMIHYLVDNGFNFTEVIPKERIEDTEILAEKIIG